MGGAAPLSVLSCVSCSTAPPLLPFPFSFRPLLLYLGVSFGCILYRVPWEIEGPCNPFYCTRIITVFTSRISANHSVIHLYSDNMDTILYFRLSLYIIALRDCTTRLFKREEMSKSNENTKPVVQSGPIHTRARRYPQDHSIKISLSGFLPFPKIPRIFLPFPPELIVTLVICDSPSGP